MDQKWIYGVLVSCCISFYVVSLLFGLVSHLLLYMFFFIGHHYPSYGIVFRLQLIKRKLVWSQKRNRVFSMLSCVATLILQATHGPPFHLQLKTLSGKCWIQTPSKGWQPSKFSVSILEILKSDHYCTKCHICIDKLLHM